MASAMTTNNPDPAVVVEGGVLFIDGFAKSEPEVVEIVAEADDPVAAVHSLLEIGSRSVRFASTSLDGELIERRFTSMADQFARNVETAVTRVTDTTSELLDEETGALPKVIAGVRKELESLLGDTFDEDSKTSVIAKIEAAVVDVNARLFKTVTAKFDLDDPSSPLARTERELREALREEASRLMQEVSLLRESVASGNAAAAVARKLTSKGGTFEELVARGLEPIASYHGDFIKQVGTTTGSAGTKKGDVLVTLCSDDTYGRYANFVIEAKDRPLTKPKTLTELDAAAENYEAAAAVAVFSGADLAPIPMTFWYSGPRAIAVFDKDDPDPGVLELAYQWARWMTRRSVVADDEEALDLAAIEAAITRAAQALGKAQSIRGCHSTVKKQVDEAGTHLDALVYEVAQALRDLRDLLGPDEG